MKRRGFWPRAAAVAAGGALLSMLAGALVSGVASAREAGDVSTDLAVSVTAEVVEDDAPVSVEATDPTMDEQGRFAHGVRVTWDGEGTAFLSDERFTHHVTGEDGSGDVVLSGRGCGAEWNEQQGEVVHMCTLDLRIIELASGETHEYPVWIYSELGPLSLEAGTYVVEQSVQWWREGSEEDPEEFTIRLTYDVTEAQAETDLDIDVAVELVEDGAPVSVSVTDVTEVDGLPTHGVRVTWNGDIEGRLDDARFTHHIEGSAGDLVTTGRGCGAQVDEDGTLSQFCQEDLQIIDLAPGETHEYPVRIHPDLEGFELAPGTYVVEEVIGWETSVGRSVEGFTVRLTYTVTEGSAETPGQLNPEPAAAGITISTWSGGPASDLPDAESYWITVDGAYVAYVPDAPDFVNARFLDHFEGDIPAGTLFIVVR